MTFTPNTHRTIQLNPHTSSSIPVKSDGNGFLGLFATLSNDPKKVLSSTNTPLYIGDIDLEELKKFHNFEDVKNSNSKVATYLKLKDLLDSTKKQLEKKKNSSPIHATRNQLFQNRRLSIEEDPDEKITALQKLVRSNIADSLQAQHGHSVAGDQTDLSKGHMPVKYRVPHAVNLNMYNSQVEKPGPVTGQLQHLPFLMQDPNQYQSIMINPQATVDTLSLQSRTQNPLNNDMHSTLPFLEIPYPDSNSVHPLNNQPLVLNNIFSKGSLSNGAVYPASPLNNQNTYGKGLPMQNIQALPSLPAQQDNLHVNSLYGTSFVTPTFSRMDSFPQSHIQPNPIPTPQSSKVPYSHIHYSKNDLGSQLMRAEDEQRSLAVQLAQLKQVEQKLKKKKNNLAPNYLPRPQPTVSSTLTKSLTSFPMNFEDMLSTGLKLAEQSSQSLQNLQQSSPSLQSQNVAQMIHPRSSPQTSWSSVSIPSMSQYSKTIKKTDDFHPSRQISQKVAQPKSGYSIDQDNQIDEVHLNSIDSGQIHIIGPNCYIMSQNGFKLVGTSPNCVTVDKKEKNKKQKLERNDRRQNGKSGSLWDSIKSMPLVNKFAKTFGIKK